MKTWLTIVVVLFIVIPSMISAQPAKIRRVRKTCGRDLVDRVNKICESRGGHMTHTQVRRVRRGIVDECCTKVCLDHHIYAYCSNNPERSQTETGESETSIELPTGLEEAVRSSDIQNSIQRNVETITDSPIQQVTAESVHLDIDINGNIDSEFVQRLIKRLPPPSNDFQVGTVPPEFRILPKKYLVPSHVRLIH